MSDVSETIGKVAEKVVEETGKNATSPQWTLNVLVLGMCGVLLLAFVGIPTVWFIYVGKPSAEAQNEAVRASTEAIRSNADSNRKMCEAISKVSTSVEEINQHFRRSSERMTDVVNELKSIEKAQDESLRVLADKINRSPSGS